MCDPGVPKGLPGVLEGAHVYSRVPNMYPRDPQVYLRVYPGPLGVPDSPYTVTKVFQVMVTKVYYRESQMCA